MEELECSSCGYKFRSGKIVARCPYCSKEEAVISRKSAQDFLDETLGEKEMMDKEREKRKV